jgi:hypothetical protein
MNVFFLKNIYNLYVQRWLLFTRPGRKKNSSYGAGRYSWVFVGKHKLNLHFGDMGMYEWVVTE